MGRLFPVIEDGGLAGDFGHVEIAYRLRIGLIVVKLEELGEVGILRPEVLKLRIRHRLILPTLPQHGKHVPSGNLALILLLFVLFSLLLFDSGATTTGPRTCLLLLIEGHSAIGQQKFEDLLLVVLLGPVRWREVLLVLQGQVRSLLDQEVHHVVLVLLDGVVDRSLLLRVGQVKVRPMLNEKLGHLDETLSDTVVDC